MSKNRFMVIKFKELLKTALFAVLGVVIIIGLIYFFLPKSDETALYKPGTYEAEMNLQNEIVAIEITVDKERIKSIALKDMPETVPVFYPLVESTAQTLTSEILKKQSLDVTIPQENPYSAKLFLDAVAAGLEQAKR